MQAPQRALLLTTLVLPGLGHWVLKRYVVALLLLIATFISGYLIVDNAIQTANKIVAQIQVGTVVPGIEELMGLVQSAYAEEKQHRPNAAVFTLILCWFIGVIDVYRINRKTVAR